MLVGLKSHRSRVLPSRECCRQISGVWSPPVAHKGELRTQSGTIGKQKRPSSALAANSRKYVRTTNGGVGERGKPAILKNKTGDSLSNTKFNEIHSDALGNQLEGDTLTVLAPVKAGQRASTSDKPPLVAFPKITGSRWFAIPSIVVELRRCHVCRLPAEGLLLVRNFGEFRLPSNKVAPGRLPRSSCPKQPPTKGGLPPRFYPAPNSATGDPPDGPGLPLCAELQDLRSAK